MFWYTLQSNILLWEYGLIQAYRTLCSRNVPDKVFVEKEQRWISTGVPLEQIESLLDQILFPASTANMKNACNHLPTESRLGLLPGRTFSSITGDNLKSFRTFGKRLHLESLTRVFMSPRDVRSTIFSEAIDSLLPDKMKAWEPIYQPFQRAAKPQSIRWLEITSLAVEKIQIFVGDQVT